MKLKNPPNHRKNPNPQKTPNNLSLRKKKKSKPTIKRKPVCNKFLQQPPHLVERTGCPPTALSPSDHNAVGALLFFQLLWL